MKVIRQFTGLSPIERGAVVALGNFDGVHKGHQTVIRAAAREANAMGAPLGVVVFEPHPQEFFKPEGEAFRLTPLPSKARILSDLGVDFIYALPFDTDLASKLAQEFVMDVLVDGMGIVHAVAGYDFHFGRSRAGNPAVLGYMGEMEGFGTTIVPAEMGNDEVHSSTRVRELLKHGKPREAAAILGRPWAVVGRVREGDKRGRTIGFPTANLSLDGYLKPAFGVYAAKVEITQGPEKGRRFDAVCNVGTRPTFDKDEALLEAHIFGFDGDLYTSDLAVHLIEFLRYERKFSGLDELKAQIQSDSDQARKLLETEPFPEVGED